jgi:capsular exopolysaccharide synthesis family protein
MHRIDPRLVSVTAPGCMEAEQYQALRLRIERLQAARDLKVIVIASPGARDGKTVTAINLAASLGRGTGARVLLIEADVRRPSMTRYLRLEPDGRGTFSAALAEASCAPFEVAERPDGMPFDLMLAGTPDKPVHDMFRSARLPELLREARERYDYVLIDTPPLGLVSDCALLARWVDGLLVVVSAHKTTRSSLEHALDQLDANAVIGIVFNGDKRPLFGYRSSYYRGYFPSQAA